MEYNEDESEAVQNGFLTSLSCSLRSLYSRF